MSEAPIVIPQGMPRLPAKSMQTLARIVTHMASGGSMEIRIRLHHGGVRAYQEVTYPLHVEEARPLEEP
jgi:hypothetical protein